MSPREIARGRELFNAYQSARRGLCHITLLKTRSELENWLIGNQEDLIVTAERTHSAEINYREAMEAYEAMEDQWYEMEGKLSDCRRLLARICQLGKECGAMAIALAGRDVTFAHETIDIFEAASEEDKADHLAFFDSGGPKQLRDLKGRDDDGTPTSKDLEKLL